MKIKNTVIISESKLNDKIESRYHEGVAEGIKRNKAQVANLDKAVAKKNKEIERLQEQSDDDRDKYNREVQKLEAKLDILEQEREDVREVVKQEIDNEDLAAVLAAKKEAMDRKEAKLKDREARIGQEEEGEYKRGYADGVADGVRKINEITASDREGAMKVAMVAAASHSTPEVVRELNNVKSLASGTEDQEG